MIRLKNPKKQYQDFRSLPTTNAITRQWNAIKYKKDKATVSAEELEYILKNTTNLKVYKEVMSYYQPKAKKAGLHWYTKSERTEKNFKKTVAENRQRNTAKRLLDEVGIGKYMQKELFFRMGQTMIPNPKMIGETFEDISKEMREIMEDDHMSDIAINEAIRRKKDEFDFYSSEIKKINKNKVAEIERESTERLENFLFEHADSSTKSGIHHGYFGLLIGSEIEKDKLKALLGQLNTGEKLAIENLLLSQEFMQQWCSDQKSRCYDEEFRKERLDEVIKIIENYIGKGVEYNPETKQMEFYQLEAQNAVTTGLKLDDYIGR